MNWKGQGYKAGSLLTALALILLIVGCASPTAPPAPAVPGETPKPTSKPAISKLVEINVAVATKSGGYTPLYVGMAKGFYAEEGLKVEPVIMKTNIATAALLSGSIDFVAPPGGILQAASQGAPVRVIMLFQNKPSWSLMARPEIRSVKDLKGKAVGMGTKGSSTEYVSMKILQSAGLDPVKDATYVGLGGDPQVRLGSLKTGAVSALLETYPQTYLAAGQGAHVLAVAAEILPEWPQGGISSTLPRIKGSPEQVKGMLRASVKGMMWAQNNKEETVKILMEQLELDRELVMKTYDDFMKGMARNGEISDKGLVTEFATLKEFGQWKGEIPSANQLADWTILREVRKGLNLTP
ncbi:MAG: ABC transporter substrate-binding protein [Chloroflexi bacterium]|nr:ABC transporter substrate-binding protein [Chloroflexota bacterium]